MTPEQREVHERLSRTLPSRIHGDSIIRPTWVELRARRRQRKVVIFGRHYDSLWQAAEALGVTRATIGYYIKTKKKGCRYAR